MAAAKNTLQKLLDQAGQFVTKQKGSWDHAQWEAFLESTAKAGVEPNDEVKRNLGNILEASKYFYGITASAAPTKAAAKKPATRKPAARKKAP
jgi:hypothetical protein